MCYHTKDPTQFVIKDFKSQNRSVSIWRAKRATLNVIYSVTDRTKIGIKCQNWKIQIRHLGRFSNTVLWLVTMTSLERNWRFRGFHEFFWKLLVVKNGLLFKCLSLVIARFLKVSPYVILCDICKVSLALEPPLLALDFSFDFRSGW